MANLEINVDDMLAMISANSFHVHRATIPGITEMPPLDRLAELAEKVVSLIAELKRVIETMPKPEVASAEDLISIT